uniref:Glyoxalase-like domain-containing protein n=2 Tax=Schizophyllum commune (strain H4-8 / FGSC 9210) TaxID=578458 RepID=D8PU48_SCHCM
MAPTPPTNILDHIVHLAPNVKDATENLTKLGFNVLPGGTHADGLTENALISFPDGTYVELISFTHDPSYYPPGSPERAAREAHRWANKSSGWIDYAFLGNGVLDPPNRISDLVNARATAHGGEPIYKAEVPGGRLRPDGVRLDWVITAGEEEGVLGLIPFFCGDVTERRLRVPSSANDTTHPFGAQGVTAVRILVSEEDLPKRKQQVADIVGAEALQSTERSAHFPLAKNADNGVKGSLILSVPQDDEEREYLRTHGSALYELHVKAGGDQDGVVKTPFGRIVFE